MWSCLYFLFLCPPPNLLKVLDHLRWARGNDGLILSGSGAFRGLWKPGAILQPDLNLEPHGRHRARVHFGKSFLGN